ncbi:MAG: protein kinase [Candidatus Eremiobacteraeota bacterium]|nr:protein kinase [Candidatus Eremiobacteraeota bacterium]MCW5867972.1 protein kinase [Candidatus Eremiobacteraeota bacterium]
MWPLAELKALRARAVKVSYQAGEVIFQQGDPGDRVYLIRRGLIEIYADSGGKRRRLNLRGRGEVIGEMAVLDGLGRSATAVALTDVQAHTLETSEFENLLCQRPALIRGLTRQLSQRMRDLQETLSAELDRREAAISGILQSIGPFQLEERLGQGGMGVIYAGFHQVTGHKRAIKVLAVQSDEQKQRFLTECETMARLIHPHVVRIDSAGIVDGQGYMAMELLRGQTLEQRLRQGRLLRDEVGGWFVPAMRALHYAHELGVMHRDVKPENLFMTLDGQLKVLDFGIARRVNGPQVTLEGKFFGTPRYLAPERIGGQSQRQERQSDQYSLGVTLYEALTGRCPFEASDVAEILAAHLHRAPELPSRIVPLEKELELVVMRLLAKEPLRRYPDFERAARELSQALAGGSGSGTAELG